MNCVRARSSQARSWGIRALLQLDRAWTSSRASLVSRHVSEHVSHMLSTISLSNLLPGAPACWDKARDTQLPRRAWESQLSTVPRRACCHPVSPAPLSPAPLPSVHTIRPWTNPITAPALASDSSTTTWQWKERHMAPINLERASPWTSGGEGGL